MAELQGEQSKLWTDCVCSIYVYLDILLGHQVDGIQAGQFQTFERD